jgi:hypothetical protein
MSLYAQDIQVFVQSHRECFSMCDTTNFIGNKIFKNYSHFHNHAHFFGTMIVFLEPHFFFLGCIRNT